MERTCILAGCGKPAHKLKDFCCYAHRGAWKALRATEGRTGLSGSKNTLQNRALQTLKRQSVGQLTFRKINSCTYRVSARGEKQGWLKEVAWAGGARQRWVAHLGNRASEPLRLEDSKRAAVALLRERGKTEPRNWIAELNKIAAAEFDRVALAQERKQWPHELLGAELRAGSMQIDRKLRDAILNAELVAMPSRAEPSGDDFQLEFYDDGFPKLPECLRRKARHGQ